MKDDEFIALDPGLLRHPSVGISRHHRLAAPGADASAIQGRLSAQVALLQSPILPAAQPPYPQQTKSSNIPVDNTHTSIRCVPLVRCGPASGNVNLSRVRYGSAARVTGSAVPPSYEPVRQAKTWNDPKGGRLQKQNLFVRLTCWSSSPRLECPGWVAARCPQSL